MYIRPFNFSVASCKKRIFHSCQWQQKKRKGRMSTYALMNCNRSRYFKENDWLIFYHRLLNIIIVICKIAIERKIKAMFFEAIYESLNWSRHVKAVLSKMSRYVGILYKIKRYLVTLDRYTIALCNRIQIFALLSGDFSEIKHRHTFLKKWGMRAVIPELINYKYWNCRRVSMHFVLGKVTSFLCNAVTREGVLCFVAYFRAN